MAMYKSMILRGSFYIVGAVALLLTMVGCSAPSGLVARIGDVDLTKAEYERQFIKNNGGKEAALKSTLEDRKEFLDLLVKFRLKVLDAYEKGYDRDPEIRKELAQYRQSLATPYYIEKQLVEPAVKRLYDRRQTEVRASHILIRIKRDSVGVEDTLSAYKQALDIIRRVKAGEPFDSLAVKYSEDKNTSIRGGDLYYFTAGMTLPSFDEAVYSLKPGQVLDHPVRTPFGYHVVKVTDRRKARGQLRGSHILVRIPPQNPTDTAAAFSKISLILDSLKSGAPFDSLAMRNSEDPSSAAKGGDLGWMDRYRMVIQFANAAYQMKVGETSGIVRTPYGYHIIRITGERPPRSFEEQKQELKDLYKRYGYKEDYARFIESLKKKHGFRVNTSVLEDIRSKLDSTKTTSSAGWDSTLTAQDRQMVLIMFKEAPLTVEGAVAMIQSTPDLQTKPLTREGWETILDKLAELQVLKIETRNLEQRYPDFADLMHEYREGVLLFKAEQEAVWNRVSVTDDALRKYYEEHKDKYRWPNRVKFTEVYVASDSLRDMIADSLKAGKDIAELAARHTQRPGYKQKKGSWGFQPETTNDLSRKAYVMKKGEISDPIKFEMGYSFIRVDEKDPARIKTFEEAMSEVSSDFQEYESKRLERDWIDGLKKKFGVEIYEDNLTDVFSGLRSEAQPASTGS